MTRASPERDAPSRAQAEPDGLTQLLLTGIRWIACGEPIGAAGPLDGPDAERACRIADLHGLCPALYCGLSAGDAEAGARYPRLRRAYYVGAARAALALEQMRECLGALARASVPTILLKGNDTILTLYPDPALRRLSDIDLLIEEHRFRDAGAALESIGYSKAQTSMSRSEEWLNLRYLGGVAFTRGRDLPIEVHSGFLRGYGRREEAIADAWQLRVPIECAHFEACSLPPPMGFIGAALHLHGNYCRSIPYLKDAADLLLLARRVSANGTWESVWSVCDRWGVVGEVRGVAAFLNRHLDAGIPACEGTEPPFDASDLAYAMENLRGRGRLTEGLALRREMAHHLPSLSARLGLWTRLVAPLPDFLRWRYHVPVGRPIWPWYVRHLARAVRRVVHDIAVRALTERRHP